MEVATLHPAQSLIAFDTHRFRVVNCGRRFGKTVLSAWEMLGVAVAHKDRRVPYYAPTRDDARDIMWATLNKICDPLIVYKNESRLELTIKTKNKGTSGIFLYGWESVQERGKGRGVANDFMVLDEVAMYRNFWEGWHEVLRPTLTDRKGGALFPSTPKGFNHFYDLYNLEAKDPDYKSFHFTTYDNPFIPREEIEKAKIELTEDRFAQEYLADFRKQEGLVYKEFSRDKHLFDDKTDRGTIVSTIIGIDWGYRHPAAVLTIEKNASGHYWVVDEWSHTGRTEEDAIEYAFSKRPNRIYPDPENPQACEKARRAGLNVHEVVKGKGSIKSGVDTVRELFKDVRLHIHNTNCPKLINSLETHAYKENTKGEEFEEEGKDACDALRYPIMMDAPIPVEEPYSGDFNLYTSSYN